MLLGKDTFTHGRLGGATIEATLKALEGFRRIMDTYGVVRYRAVATSAVREASNRDTFLDRIRLRTGIDVEVIDGSEENRLTYMAVREQLRRPRSADRPRARCWSEVGGGSADISFLRKGEPLHSGTYALGSIRMRQSLASGTAATSSACACCAATSTTWSRTSAARCRCARSRTSWRSAATCASRPRAC